MSTKAKDSEAQSASKNAFEKNGRVALPDQPGGRPIPSDPDALLFTEEAAHLRGQSPRTLEKERVAGGGCPFVLLGRSVRYRRRDVLDHIERQIRLSTSHR
jgi:hypothetical protein